VTALFPSFLSGLSGARLRTATLRESNHPRPAHDRCPTILTYVTNHWDRRLAKVEHHEGELLPRVGFIVTNLTLPSRPVMRFYNKRGTVMQLIKEGNQAVKMTRLSCHRFRSNEVGCG
jgi:Transposase DDE domain group 1